MLNLCRRLLARIYSCDLLWITCLYFMIYGVMLANRGFFADSWNFWLCDVDSIKADLSHGGPQLRVLFLYFIPFRDIADGDILLRVINLSAHFISILALYGCLKRVPSVNRFLRFMIVAFFAIYPINNARIELVHVAYSINTAYFWIGMYCYCRLLESKTNSWRWILLSALFSFASFTSAAYLVLYCVLLPLIYIVVEREFSFAALPRFFRKYGYLFMLPFVYWGVRHLFFMPTGRWANYYGIGIFSVEGFLKVLILYATWIYTGGVCLFIDMFSPEASILPVPVMLVLTLLLGHRLFALYQQDRDALVPPKYLLLTGLFLLLCGLFPYCAANKLPAPFNPDSRHEMLLGIGLSLLTVGVLIAIVRRFKFSDGVTVLLLAFVIIRFVDFGMYRQYQNLLLNFRSDAIVASLKANDEIKQHKTLIVQDEAISLGRRVFDRPVMYTGMAHLAYGGFTRRYINVDYARPYERAITTSKAIDKYWRGIDLLGDYEVSPPTASLLITAPRDDLTVWECGVLLFWRMKNTQEYMKRVSSLVSIEIIPPNKRPKPFDYLAITKNWLMTEKHYYYVGQFEYLTNRYLFGNTKP